MREDYITLLHKNPLLKNYFKKILNFSTRLCDISLQGDPIFANYPLSGAAV